MAAFGIISTAGLIKTRAQGGEGIGLGRGLQIPILHSSELQIRWNEEFNL